MSLISISYLQWLIDPVRRMMEGRRIGIDTWQKRDAEIKPFILKIKNGKEFQTVDEEATDLVGKSLLELSVQYRLLNFTKVNDSQFVITIHQLCLSTFFLLKQKFRKWARKHA